MLGSAAEQFADGSTDVGQRLWRCCHDKFAIDIELLVVVEGDDRGPQVVPGLLGRAVGKSRAPVWLVSER